MLFQIRNGDLKKVIKILRSKNMYKISSIRMHKELEAAGIDATLILDASLGYILEHADLVMLGAEGVTESGGIINKVQTKLY